MLWDELWPLKERLVFGAIEDVVMVMFKSVYYLGLDEASLSLRPLLSVRQGPAKDQGECQLKAL